jgi:hypothetical protein
LKHLGPLELIPYELCNYHVVTQVNA